MPMTCLIIEEPGLPRNVLVKTLTLWGYQCVLAESNARALSEMKKSPAPALLLANWQTNVLDCEKFFRLARRNQTDSYILAAVAASSTDGIRRSIMAGANDFVRWPYDLDEVRVRLHIARLLLGMNAPESCFPTLTPSSTPESAL